MTSIFIILLMLQKSGDHQVRLVVYPMIYMVSYIPGGDRWISSTKSRIVIDSLRTIKMMTSHLYSC